MIFFACLGYIILCSAGGSGSIFAPAALFRMLSGSRIWNKWSSITQRPDLYAWARYYIRDRSLGKIAAYPEYLLLGAGDGRYDRFPLPGVPVNEPHCTIAAVWFAYGIPGVTLLLVWICGGIRAAYREDAGTLPGMLALLAESCTLLNYRQPFFWMILGG